MRLVVALMLAVFLVAGCTSKSTTDPGTGTSAAPSSAAASTSSHASSSTPASHPSTSSGPTSNSPPPSKGVSGANVTHQGLLVHKSFSGTAPAPTTGQTSGCPGEPDAICPTYTFDVPAGGNHLTLWYNTTYVGAFSADVSITDPEGTSSDTLTACGIPPPGAQATFACVIDLPTELVAGTWTIAIAYQAGEATENYVIDVSAWGLLPGAA